MTATFAFVTPTAFYPVMRGVATYRADYANFVAFALKVIATICFACKMGTETEYIHKMFFPRKDNAFFEL